MKQVVIFMYTGKCEINDSNCKRTSRVQLRFSVRTRELFFSAYDLLDAAGRYDIKDLKVHVGRCSYENLWFGFNWEFCFFLWKVVTNRINSNNVLTLIRAAYKYENKMVKQYCIQYFIDHAKEIMDIHERWKDFAEQQPDIVADLFHWLVHKEDFYKQKPEWERRSNWSWNFRTRETQQNVFSVSFYWKFPRENKNTASNRIKLANELDRRNQFRHRIYCLVLRLRRARRKKEIKRTIRKC